MRVAIYARYSSDRQSEASIEDQLRICRVRAQREGWVEAHVYSDAAISGATTDRPGYQALLTALRQGGIDIVLAESLDRLSRDQEHIAAFYKQAIFAGTRIVTLAEGDISELHVGLKGTMGALYLKDLAQKTIRGQEGRVREGRAIGIAPYGYRVVRKLGSDGEPDRGLREIDEAQAKIVHRIFQSYAGGFSPRAIARVLNAEGIPGPSGGIWYDASIRGRPTRGDGLLRNALYIGLMVWNRVHSAKDPVSGVRHRRTNEPDQLVIHEVPELRIVDQGLWDRVQVRLEQERAPRTALVDAVGASPGSQHRFWERRRPRHLLTGKVVCGACGALFAGSGNGYIGCRSARQNACRNTKRLQRAKLEAHVMEVLGRQLMDPAHVAEFVAAFSDEWNRLIAEHRTGGEARRRELQVVERKIGNLIDALSEGIRSPDLRTRLTTLEEQRAILMAGLAEATTPPPAMHPNLAQVYRDKVARLGEALRGPDGMEALEAARELVEQVIVSPPENDDDPPGIEVIGEFVAMLKAAGLGFAPRRKQAENTDVLRLFAATVKEGPGAKPPIFLPSILQNDAGQPRARTTSNSTSRAPGSLPWAGFGSVIRASLRRALLSQGSRSFQSSPLKYIWVTICSDLPVTLKWMWAGRQRSAAAG